MKEKEFVLVSQGIEIFRTKSQEKAVNMVKEENDEYFDYLQKCYDNYERPADNYIDLEIEYPDEKEKDKEIERLQRQKEELQVNGLRQETLFKLEIERLNNIINRIKSIYQSLCFSAPENDYIFIEQLGEVLQELKGSDKVE